MKINLTYVVLLCLVFLGFTACKKEDKLERSNTVEIQLEKPVEFPNLKVKTLEVTFKETNTGNTMKWSGSSLNFTENLPTGIYHIQVEGTASYEEDGATQEINIGGVLEGAKVVSGQEKLALKLYMVSIKADFVIEEIYFTGSRTPENELYLGDRYIKVYNNSDQVLYADGLVLATTAFQTVDKQNYTPNIMDKAVAVNAVMVLPGTGKMYPVQPGASIIIAESAINHKEINSQAINLTKADFEIVDPEDMDAVDNPSVPNLNTMYGHIVIHNRGYQSFVLARIPVGKEAYLKDYTYDYSYKFVDGDFSFDIEESVYKIPNEWVLDAVNLSVQSEFQWLVTAPSLDKGWTYCGKFDGDATRFGKSVRRKVLSTSATGQRILKDTNNSTVDFDAEVLPSLKN